MKVEGSYLLLSQSLFCRKKEGYFFALLFSSDTDLFGLLSPTIKNGIGKS
ncbi:hypothetical protein BH24BAC1_BH24BAC1_31410 [soil metagenome]